MPDFSPPQPWTTFRARLREAVPEQSWEVYLDELTLRSLTDERLVLEAPAEQCEWIVTRYSKLLHACADASFPGVVEVQVVAGGEGLDTPVTAQANVNSARARASGAANPRLTFNQFVIGSCNQLAHAAALAVAEMPGLTYNPLYICGAPGLGKSHLLHSIANYAGAHGDNLAIRLTTAETFTNEFLAALHGQGDMGTFKRSHRGVDLLLVDDVQFLQSKARTEQEFFHLFNELHASGVQIVLTSDRPPRDLDALEARLRERFEAGLVCEVRPADLQTRLTVLRKRVLQDDLRAVEPTALDLIADRVPDNIRALEGALIRVVAHGSLTGRAVDAVLATEVLDQLYPRSQPEARSIGTIQARVCAVFEVTLEDLLSARRSTALAWPRQLAMFLARELTDESLPTIGAAFGGRSHTTVLHAHRKATACVRSDPDAAALVDRLTQELGAP